MTLHCILQAGSKEVRYVSLKRLLRNFIKLLKFLETILFSRSVMKPNEPFDDFRGSES